MSSKIFLLFVIMIFTAAIAVSCNTIEELTTQQGDPTSDKITTATAESSSSTKAITGVSEDVPIMPDGYDIEVRNPYNIAYKINLPIEDVVEYYQRELPNYGWYEAQSEERVIESKAQIVRGNANGDIIAISITYFPEGDFTGIQIYLTRAI